MANPAQLKDPRFSQEEIAAILTYAKAEYMDKGVTDLGATIRGVANDLGLHPDWVLRALTESKAIRRVYAELYRAMVRRKRAIEDAQACVRNLDTPFYKRAISETRRRFRRFLCDVIARKTRDFEEDRKSV